MPKLKTHKGVSKKIGNNGKIGRPGSRHNNGKKSMKANRKNRKGSVISKADSKRLKNLI